MIDTIYIPTLGRSHNQITFDNMTSNAQQITKLVVQPKEKHLYGNYPIIVLPNNDIGITETRKFIWKHGKESSLRRRLQVIYLHLRRYPMLPDKFYLFPNWRYYY